MSNYLSHCETLQYLAITNHTLSRTLDTISGEVNFTKCTELQEIVLIAANFKRLGHHNSQLKFDSIGHVSISS
jgi:hypothetical protein